jgi:cysteine desulfurase family protein (TIGR01976 family)
MQNDSRKFDHAFVQSVRQQFPALVRTVSGKPVVFLDGPGGTQVPHRVITAIGYYLIRNNANHGGLFATSIESDELLAEAHRAGADFLGADDPDCISFGLNMTSLTFALSRAVARRLQPGDEVVVTRLDHDANVSPWALAAQDARALVKYVDINRDDCTLDMNDFASRLSPRTRLVAVGCASNANGTVNPVRQICEAARAVGAWTFLDAVHFAPHARINVREFGCDFLACSAYKFFGPHVGMLWGRRELLEELVAYKVRPAPHELPGKWMTGTQNHEGMAGTLAAIEYLAEIGQTSEAAVDRRTALDNAMAAIQQYERTLLDRLLAGLAELPNIKVWGITDRNRLAERLPTVSITHAKIPTLDLAKWLCERGFFVWHGNYYALQLTETLGLEPQGMVRIGLVHYNTMEEVERLLTALREKP